MTYVVSSVSAASPDMSDDAFARFVDDIRENGQLVPIWVRGSEVIDGRKRLRACEALGIEPKVINVDPWQNHAALSRSLNALRTHYTPSQLAMYAAERATRPHGNQSSSKLGTRPPDIGQAARDAGVAKSYVSEAKVIKRDATPEVTAAVKAGKLTLHAAKQVADLPKERQRAAVEKIIEASKGLPRQTPAAVLREGPKPVRVSRGADANEQMATLCDKFELFAGMAEQAVGRVRAGQEYAVRLREVRTRLTGIIKTLEA